MTVGIYTGASESSFHFSKIMLRSLSAFNDERLPIVFLDFGLSSKSRDWVMQSNIVSEYKIIGDDDLYFLRCVNSINGSASAHLMKTLKKLVVLRESRFSYFWWVDADIVFPQNTSLIFFDGGDLVYGSRLNRSGVRGQLIDAEFSVEEELNTLVSASKPPAAMNSGLFGMSSNLANILIKDFEDPIITKYSRYLFGDQSFINLAIAFHGSSIEPLDVRINDAAAREGIPVSVHDNKNGPPEIFVNGRKSWAYHFLGYKPYPGKVPSSEHSKIIQSFYDLSRKWYGVEESE